MLVIKVELWPGGRGVDAREIGRAAAANVSEVASLSDYVAVLRDDTGHQSSVHLANHMRQAGFWPLLARIALSHAEAADSGITLEPRWQALAEKIGDRMYLDDWR